MFIIVTRSLAFFQAQFYPFRSAVSKCFKMEDSLKIAANMRVQGRLPAGHVYKGEFISW